MNVAFCVTKDINAYVHENFLQLNFLLQKSTQKKKKKQFNLHIRYSLGLSPIKTLNS